MAVSADPTRRASDTTAADEATPLLNGPDTAGGKAVQPDGTLNGDATKPSDQDAHKATASPADDEKPLPYLQILVLCYSSLVEPVAYFSIFPYINEMVERTGGQDVENVGFWTGMIESLFSLVQMLLMIFYGRLADRLGRKPVLVFSLAGVAGASALFGMSASLWQMVCLRCLAGVFAGSSVTIRAMLSENCTKSTQARAFSWYMFTRNLGIFIGPLIGGGLANPAQQYKMFQNVQFFKDFPYALPSFVCGAFVLTTTLASAFLLNETLDRKAREGDKANGEMTTWELLSAPGVARVIYIYGHVTLMALAYTAVNPVFLYTPIPLGGLSFTPQQISLFIIIAGASQALWMLLVFPPFQRRTSTGTILRICALVWPFGMAMYPLFNELVRHGHRTAFWALGPAGLVLLSGVSMSFACVQLCLNDIAPSPLVVGTLNAVALAVSSGLRAVAPMAFTSVFASGVKLGWLDGHLVWIVLVLMGVALNFGVRLLPEKAEGDLKKQKKEEEEEEEEAAARGADGGRDQE